jgi:hypothetical protein
VAASTSQDAWASCPCRVVSSRSIDALQCVRNSQQRARTLTLLVVLGGSALGGGGGVCGGAPLTRGVSVHAHTYKRHERTRRRSTTRCCRRRCCCCTAAARHRRHSRTLRARRHNHSVNTTHNASTTHTAHARTSTHTHNNTHAHTCTYTHAIAVEYEQTLVGSKLRRHVDVECCARDERDTQSDTTQQNRKQTHVFSSRLIGRGCSCGCRRYETDWLARRATHNTSSRHIRRTHTRCAANLLAQRFACVVRKRLGHAAKLRCHNLLRCVRSVHRTHTHSSTAHGTHTDVPCWQAAPTCARSA